MFCFKRILALSTLIGLTACDSATINEPAPTIGAASPSTVAQLQQGGFESGFGAWQSCGGSKGHTITGDTTFGQSAAKLSGQACIYQTVAVAPGDTYQLNCKTRRDGVGWGALMLGYLNSAYDPVDSIEKEITNTSFATSSLQLATPAGASHLEVLAYTTGEAELILDNCNIQVVSNTATSISNRVADGITPTAASVRSEQSFGQDPEESSKAGEIDWARAWMVHNELSIWVSWETYSEIDTSLWGLGIYMDTDQDRSTGYRGPDDEYPIGVDYLIEGTSQYTYTGSGNDWSWTLAANVGTGAIDSAAIRSVPVQRFGDVNAIDLFFRGDNNAVGVDTIDFYPNGVTDNNVKPASRYFTYHVSDDETPVVEPPVVEPPVVEPPVSSGVARIDVRNNLEGDDAWSVGAPFEQTITVFNTGQEPLTNVRLESDQIPGCAKNYATLAVGESKTHTCTSTASTTDAQFIHVVTATADGADGSQVSDSDQSSHRSAFRATPRETIVATPDHVGIQNGDDVTFIVEVAMTGNSTSISELSSNIEDCKRTFNPPLGIRQFERFTCVAENVQLPFTAEFGTRRALEKVELLPAGTVSLAINQSRSFGYLVGEIENNGAEDLTNIVVSNPELPQCDQQFEYLRAGFSKRYTCPVVAITGEVIDSVATVSAMVGDGTDVVANNSVLIYDSKDISLDIQWGPTNGIILTEPGEPLAIDLTITNTGYLPVSDVDSVVVSSTVNQNLCPGLFNDMRQSGAFQLAVGESKTFVCNITAPQTLVTIDDSELITADVRFVRDAVRTGFVDGGTTSVRLKKTAVHGYPAAATELANLPIATSASSVANPVVSADRTPKLLVNGDFESVDANGTPTGWEAGCNGTVSSVAHGGGLGVELRDDACITYVLGANDLALLAGREFHLVCNGETAGGSFTSMSVSLNGELQDETYVGIGFAELRGVAPAQLTEGYVSLYANYAHIFDDCQLTALSEPSAVASIDIRNHAEGIDSYEKLGTFDFELAVTNTGTVPLQDIEVGSDKLQCNTNFATLLAGETTTVLCASPYDLVRWDDEFWHLATASAKAASGVTVADIDFSRYAVRPLDNASYYLDVRQDKDTVAPGDTVNLTVNIASGTHGSVRLITSNVGSCNKIIEPHLQFGDTISFECAVENIQETTRVEFSFIREDRYFPITRGHTITVN